MADRLLEPFDRRLGQPVTGLRVETDCQVAAYRAAISLIGDDGSLEGKAYPAGFGVVGEPKDAAGIGKIVGVPGAVAGDRRLEPLGPLAKGRRGVEWNVKPGKTPQRRAVKCDLDGWFHDMHLFFQIKGVQLQSPYKALVYRTHSRPSAGNRLAMLVPAIVSCLIGVSQADEGLQRYAGSRRSMGVNWTVSVYAASQTIAEDAIEAALDEVVRLEQILSDYLPESELSQLSAAAPTPEPVEVSDDLWQVLTRAVALRDATGGAFDPTIGPLTSLWRRARRSGRLPAQHRLETARRAVGPAKLDLEPRQKKVALRADGMRLDLGGIGMGYAIDRALTVLQQRQITVAMIDASGDIGVIGQPPGTTGWRIEIDPLGRRESGLAGKKVPPPLVLTLTNAAITTSGDAFQAVEIEGVRYSHIVDPRTGLGVIGSTGVTVIAADATTADALATTLSVLGPEAGLPLVEATPAAAARFVQLEDGKPVVTESRRWPYRSSVTTQPSENLPQH
jgi:thiamine biosynthesis lipoprotein